MTPQELAVVQAAMEWRYAVLANPEALRPLHNANNKLTPVLSELSRATYQLAISCEECNAGGHTCPGDGDHIPHGAANCGKHDETQPDPVLIWVKRTWADVRTGDRVRMPGTDATAHVQSAMHQRWHVDPRSSEYRPEALEWSSVRVMLATGVNGDAHQYEMDPGKPVEIEIDEATFHMLNTLGWENRVGMITS